MPILELCAGYGGLGLAVERLTGDTVEYVAEIDPAASAILAERYPAAPNLGDITKIDWSPLVGAVTTITAGFPCQDISIAGRGGGINGSRSGIWRNVVDAVRIIRPDIVFLENVSVIRRRGLPEVLGSLATAGYDAKWCSYRASGIGAAHHRDRWFCVAVPQNAHGESWDKWRRTASAETTFPHRNRGGGVNSLTPRPLPTKFVFFFPTPTASDATGGPGNSPKRTGGMNLRTVVLHLPHGGATTFP
ncbi:DNA cytosine methyltransferase [Streptomyces sp. NPDC087212]|uniref:DNA cytosine methyltransferase n=1 Tax=Streptomyces sp. NPDC087212 TaxID=3365766 RepID=UPI0037F3193F